MSEFITFIQDRRGLTLPELRKKIEEATKDINIAPTAKPVFTVLPEDHNYTWLTEKLEMWSYRRFEPDLKFASLRSPLNRAFTFYYRCFPKEIQQLMDPYLDEIVANAHAPDDSIIRYCKALGSYIKTNFTDPKMFVLVDLHTLYGYAPQYEDSTELLRSEVTQWVQGLKPRVDEALKMFNDRYFSTAMDLFAPKMKDPDVNLLYDEEYFLKNRWIYATQGTASNTNIKLPWMKNMPRDLRNKTTLAYAYTDEELRRLLFTSVPTTPRAFIKPDEIVKLRAVISADEALTVKMLALLQVLTDMFDLSDFSDALQSSGQWMDGIAQKWQHLFRNGSIPIPIDRAHFDWRTYVFQYLQVLQALKAQVLRRLRRSQSERNTVERLFDLIIQDIVPMAIEISTMEGTERIKYFNGLLSGWGLTLLLDTLISWVDHHVAKGMVKDIWGYTISEDAYFGKGDDQALWVSNMLGVLELFKVYAALGFEINPAKFAVGRTIEFLRMFMSPDNTELVLGYPARMVKSILYRKPGFSENVTAQQRFSARLSVFVQYSRRIYGLSGQTMNGYLYDAMKRDLRFMTRYTEDTVLRLINTPAAYGGSRVMGLDTDVGYAKFTSIKEGDFERLEDTAPYKKWFEAIVELDSHVVHPYNIPDFVATLFPKPSLRELNHPVDVVLKEPPNNMVSGIRMTGRALALSYNPTWSYGKNPLMSFLLKQALRFDSPLEPYLDQRSMLAVETASPLMSRKLRNDWILNQLPTVIDQNLQWDLTKLFDGKKLQLSALASTLGQSVGYGSHRSLNTYRRFACFVSKQAYYDSLTAPVKFCM